MNGNECTSCAGGAGSSNGNPTLNNYNQNNTTMNNSNSSSQSLNNLSQGWKGCVPPAPIVLKATVGGGSTNVFLPDSNGLFASYGGTSGGTSFGVVPPATLDNLQKSLFSKWFYVKGFNLQSTQTATLLNSLQLITTQMDGLNLPQTVSSSANVSNMQQNENLLNVCCGFILTASTALKLATTVDGEIVTLTLIIGACGSYGDLPGFLATNPLITCGMPNNCITPMFCSQG